MNDEFDPLEAELAALQPKAPSPRLESAVGNALRDVPASRDVPSRRGRPGRRTGLFIAIAAGAIAASAIAVAWLWSGGDGDLVEVNPPPAMPAPALAAFDPKLPSVWSFRQAAAHSDDALNVLLDQHAGRAPIERSEYVQIRGFGGFENTRQDFKGEL